MRRGRPREALKWLPADRCSLCCCWAGPANVAAASPDSAHTVRIGKRILDRVKAAAQLLNSLSADGAS